MNELKKIQYNCRKATFLIEKRMIGKITFREAIELRIHLAGCSVCRLFEKQSLLINKMVQQLFAPINTTEVRLDDSYKKELHNRIEEAINKN
jgi:hypothetical protein